MTSIWESDLSPATASAADPPTTAPSVQEQVRRAVAEMVYERSRASNLLTVPSSLLIAWLLWGHVSAMAIVLWLLVKWAVTAWRWHLDRVIQRGGPRRSLTVERYVPWAVAADGVAFGLLGTWLLPHGNQALETGLVATLIAIAAIGIVVFTGSLRASLVFTVPILLPTLIVQLWQGDRTSVYLGLGMLIFLGMIIYESRRTALHTEAMLGLKFTADELAAQRQAALIEAERSNAVKGRFLATVSHEMRTPLHGILGLSSLLQDEENRVDEALRQQRLRTLHETGEHLLGIINDVLDYSRIESGHLKLQDAEFDLHATFQACANLTGVNAQHKGLTLHRDIQLPVPCQVLGDESRLRQVLLNLLGNAVKFTPSGFVRLSAQWSAWPTGGALRVSVEDSGPGVPEADRERVFEAFEQVDGSFARRHGGTGLGLSISRELVNAMGGSLVCGQASGGGALFELSVPLQPAPVGTGAAQSAAGDVEDAAPAVHLPTQAAASKPAALAGRVLLAEDNPVNTLVATAALKKLGLQVVAVADGQAALDELKSQHSAYDLVLMDCQMPGLDGFDATRSLRAWEAEQGLRRLPVMALTANALEGDRQRSLAAGMDEHLAKPFTLTDLRAALERWLAAPQT